MDQDGYEDDLFDFLDNICKKAKLDNENAV